MNKLFSFRWDVDHRACVTDGIPKIQALCQDLRVQNTFFVNMGRSTNLGEWLGNGLSTSKAKLGDKESIHLIKKIGWPRFILETLLSRPVGASFISELKALQEDGHELGLHGGSDHVVWSRRFPVLSEEFIADDVLASLHVFESEFGRPEGFASPGFRSDDRIMRLLDDQGFLYHGDQIGGVPGRTKVNGRALSHWTIPVTICGPRTIPFLEWHGARKTPNDDVINELGKLLETDSPVVLYGHPCYEGVEIDLLRRVFETVLKRGFSFVTLGEIASQLNNGRLGAS